MPGVYTIPVLVQALVDHFAKEAAEAAAASNTAKRQETPA